MGGQGAIYSSIDGQGDLYPIAEVDNASRVIKHVGILGYRYQSYGLVDMRIHDINVVADLTRSNPNPPAPGEPEVNDGSSTGYKPAREAVNFVDTLANCLMTETSIWWTGWWPVLHLRLSRSTETGGLLTIQVGVDLLGANIVEDFVYEPPSEDGMTDTEFTALMASNWDEFYAEAFPIEAVLYAAAELIAIAMDVSLFLMTKVPTPEQLIVYTSLMVLWCGLMMAFLYAVWHGVNTGRLSYGTAFGLLILTGLVTLGENIIPILSANKFFREIWYMRGLRNGVGFRVKWCVGLSVLNAFVRFVFGAMMLLMALWVFDLQVTALNST